MSDLDPEDFGVDTAQAEIVTAWVEELVKRLLQPLEDRIVALEEERR